MKKLILVLSAIVLFVCKSYGVTITAGGLEAAMSKTDVSALTELVVDGTIDARDLHFIATKMPALTRLDLANAKVEAFSSKKSLFSNRVSFDANELPIGCFASMQLQSVSLPNTLVSVSEGAFAGCMKLASVTVPESVRAIGDYAFSGDTALVDVNLGSGVVAIGDYAFSNCSALASIKMPAVSTIGAYAFLCCEALKNVNFSFSLSSIGEGAFKESGITAANLKDCIGLMSVSAWAFADTKNLASVSLPETVTTIGEGAFFYSTSLGGIVLPEGITVINNYAFGNTAKLTNEKFLPANVKKIGDYAFEDWSEVTKFIIPASVDSIGQGAFKGWKALSLLRSEAVLPPTLGADVWQNVDKSAIELIVPGMSESAYKTADQWREFFFSGVEKPYNDESIKFTVSENILTLTAEAGLRGATIFDLSGIVLVQKVVNAPSISFDLSGYSAKAYVVRCVCADGKVEYIKFGIK